MKEVLKVKIATTTFSLDKEAHALLADWLEANERESGKEAVEVLEQRVAGYILERQSTNIVVEEAVVRDIIATIGSPEGYVATPKPPTTTPQPHQHPTPSHSTIGPLGRVFIVCAKILLGIFLAGWVLTAIGLLVGFVSLMAIGDIWTEYLPLPLEGMSPVVFAGLVCAVIVLFMGIVADLGFSLIRGKKVNIRGLVIGGVIWLIFLLWLIFACVRNANYWVVWAHESEAKIEQWERDFDEWEDRFEEQLEWAIINPSTLSGDGADIHLIYNLNDLGDSLKLEKLCEEFDELYRYDDYILGYLIKGEEVIINIDISQKDNILTRNTTITTPSGVTTIDVNIDGHTGHLLDYKTND